MATVACPGCGLPRVEAEVGATPCPVCDAAVAEGSGTRPSPAAREPDPTAGLPADVSELHTAPAPVRARALRVGAATFVVGILCGVGIVLVLQLLAAPEPKPVGPTVAAKPNGGSQLPLVGGKPNAVAVESRPAPVLVVVAVSPMPHEVSSQAITTDAKDDLVPPELPPPPGVVVTYNINLPDGAYSVASLKKGERIVLTGKVNTLRVRGLHNGAVLDASRLRAAVVTVTGRIEDGSTLKVNAPDGLIQLSHAIDARSLVELNAPGGEVKFTMTTTATREGARIDNGSSVSVTARVVEFKGDIGGAGTRVSVTLTKNAWMKFAAVTGTAVLEYKSQAGGPPAPEIVPGSVARTATFRKME